MSHKAGKKALSTLHVDCGNGVGAPKLAELSQYIGSDVLSVNIVNADTTTLGKLNKDVSNQDILLSIG